MGERQMMGWQNDEALAISRKQKRGKKHRKRTGKKTMRHQDKLEKLIKLETDETLNGEFTMAIY